MLKFILILPCIFCSNIGYSQIKPNDLIGLWTICNDDNQYNKNDSLCLIQDINYRIYSNKLCCNYINWNIISVNKIRVENAYSCSEPGKVSWINNEDDFKIIKKGKNQLISIKPKGRKSESFSIVSLKIIQVDRYPYEIRVMIIKRTTPLARGCE